MPMINILLVDDQAQVRQGLRLIFSLEDDFAVVGEAADGKEALLLVGALRPDVVVIDREMPGMDGITAAAHLRVGDRRCAVIMLSLYDDAPTRAASAAAGVVAFISKRDPPAQLITAVRQAAHQLKPGFCEVVEQKNSQQ